LRWIFVKSGAGLPVSTLLGSAAQLARQTVEAPLPALSVVVPGHIVAESLMDQNEIGGISTGMKLEGHLGFVSVGPR